MRAQVTAAALGVLLFAVAVHAAPEDVRFYGGSYDGWDRGAMTNTAGLGAVVTLSSGTDQTFDWAQTGQELTGFTIEAEDPQGTITNGGTIRVSIPTDWGGRFDTNSTVAYSGDASGKVNPASFTGDGRTVLIPVTSDFIANDTLIVSGLGLVDLPLCPSTPERLELDFTGNGYRDMYDLYTVRVSVPWPGGSYDGWDRGATTEYEYVGPPSSGMLFLVR